MSDNLPPRVGGGFASQVQALILKEDGVDLLNQNLLPHGVEYLRIRTAAEMAEAIQVMHVRGAPAIGIAAAYGVVLSARTFLAQADSASLTVEALQQQLRNDIALLGATRPTAVNLAWALKEMEKTLTAACAAKASPAKILDQLTERAVGIHQEDIRSCQQIGDYGAEIVPKGATILTHCNAGALATGGYGTALGVVRSAFARDPGIQVYADETRPRFQGARLTTWELCEDGIPVTLIADNMAAVLMQAGKIDVVIVGADRIAANGDTANKIGTYNVALIAHAHQVPFYIAAPLSTIDMSLPTGQGIPIEERTAEEVSTIHEKSICAPGARFFNPAFDVTPARYIHGIITEKGIVRPDFNENLQALFLENR